MAGDAATHLSHRTSVHNAGVTAPYLTDPLAPGPLPQWLLRLIEAKHAAATGHPEALRRFVDGMVELEPSGYVQLLCQLLESQQAPAAWHHLDRHVRQGFGWHAAAMDVVTGRLADGTAGPVSWVLAAMHPDGRVRQRAIDVICDGPFAVTGPAAEPAIRDWVSMWDFLDPDTRTGPLTILLPVLMLRSADWVEEVRDTALAALRARLFTDLRYLPAAVWSVPLVAGRTRGRQAVALTREALVVAPAPVREALIGSPDPRIRQTASTLCRTTV